MRGLVPPPSGGRRVRLHGLWLTIQHARVHVHPTCAHVHATFDRYGSTLSSDTHNPRCRHTTSTPEHTECTTEYREWNADPVFRLHFIVVTDTDHRGDPLWCRTFSGDKEDRKEESPPRTRSPPAPARHARARRTRRPTDPTAAQTRRLTDPAPADATPSDPSNLTPVRSGPDPVPTRPGNAQPASAARRVHSGDHPIVPTLRRRQWWRTACSAPPAAAPVRPASIPPARAPSSVPT